MGGAALGCFSLYPNSISLCVLPLTFISVRMETGTRVTIGVQARRSALVFPTPPFGDGRGNEIAIFPTVCKNRMQVAWNGIGPTRHAPTHHPVSREWRSPDHSSTTLSSG